MSTPTPRRPAARLRLAILLLATGLVASPVLEARPPAEPRPPAPKRLAFLCVADRRLPLLPGDVFLGEVVSRLLRFAAPVGDTLALDDVCGGAGRWLDDCGDAGRAELLAHAAASADVMVRVRAADARAASTREVTRRLASAPPPRLRARSASTTKFSEFKATYDGKTQLTYARAYGLDLDAARRRHAAFEGERWAEKSYFVASVRPPGTRPDRILALSDEDGAIVGAQYLYLEAEVPNTPFESYLPGIAFVDAHRKHFEAAADVLAARHPSVHRDNLLLFLFATLVHELFKLGNEDVLQDLGLALEADLPVAGALQTASGVPSFVAKAALKAAEALVDRERFGVGPFQGIVGLTREAARAFDGWQTLAGAVTPDDFQDGRIVGTLLDPVTSIYAKAIVVDYVLARLEATWFRDPAVVYPVDVFPSPRPTPSSREAALLATAFLVQFFPEMVAEGDFAFLDRGHVFLGQMNMMGLCFGVAPRLAGCRFESREAGQRTWSVHVAGRDNAGLHEGDFTSYGKLRFFDVVCGEP